jgi:hypothetical protein
MKTVIEMILLCLVGAEGRGRARGRLTLRLLRNQHTAATADYLMVFTAIITHIIFPGYEWNTLAACAPQKKAKQPGHF